MKKEKEICDSGFTLDDLIQESVDMNNFLKVKTSQTFHDGNNYDSLNKFFERSIKLRNASKNICWEKSNSPNNVSKLFLNSNL